MPRKSLPRKGGAMPKSRIPFFRFYPSDFMDGVRGMSAQEVGLYTMLLCRMYEESGPIEDNTLRLATYCGMREKTFTKTLDKLVALGKITRQGGMLSNHRAEIEISDRSHDLKNAIAAGKASAKKRQQNQSNKATGVQQAFNHTDTYTDTDTSSNEEDGDAVDFAKVLFDRGVAFLGRHAVPERQARALVGKWRKASGDQAVFDAFSACNKAGVTDPVPWIERRLQPSPSNTISLMDILKEGNQ
jgi:uncharacterized protein YdaU (DUF1376 family)